MSSTESCRTIQFTTTTRGVQVIMHKEVQIHVTFSMNQDITEYFGDGYVFQNSF